MSDRYAKLIPNYDFKPGCEPRGGADEFPAIAGACTYSTDALNWPCGQPSSCVETITIGGVLASEATYDPQFYLQGATLGTSMVMSGCGQMATVPINVAVLPTPTLMAAYDQPARRVDASWISDHQAASAAITLGGGFGGESCQTLDDHFTFADLDLFHADIYVQTFAPVEKFDSPFGEVRVWRGNMDSVEVAAPPPQP
ncbi:MAG: hypothetical protein NT062_33700 [Proteobacteria bacterium]|nr:hypothetical protein [Pseudomonadota bacterium]